MRTPTPIEITMAYNRICKDHSCEMCPIKNYIKSFGYSEDSSCDVTLAHAVLSGKLDLDGKSVAVSKTETTTQTCSKTEQVPNATAIPKWCKVGTWVFARTSDFEENLGMICEIEENSNLIVVEHDHKLYKDVTTYFLSRVSPVRFRNYTFKEAKALIGKTMEWVSAISCKREVELITRVEFDADGNIIINGKLQEVLINLNTYTIDGVPFGVPEVDTEAEKEAQE